MNCYQFSGSIAAIGFALVFSGVLLSALQCNDDFLAQYRYQLVSPTFVTIAFGFLFFFILLFMTLFIKWMPR